MSKRRHSAKVIARKQQKEKEKRQAAKAAYGDRKLTPNEVETGIQKIGKKMYVPKNGPKSPLWGRTATHRDALRRTATHRDAPRLEPPPECPKARKVAKMTQALDKAAYIQAVQAEIESHRL